MDFHHVVQELQNQHEILLVRLEEFIKKLEGRLQQPFPHTVIVNENEHGNNGSLWDDPDDETIFPQSLNIGSKSLIAEDVDRSTGLDSYTLAKQQGSRIDTLFKSKTEEAWNSRCVFLFIHFCNF